MLFEWSPTVLCEMDITGLLRMAAHPKGELDQSLRILKDRWAEVRGGIRLTGMNAAARKFFGVDPSQGVPNVGMQAAEDILAGLLEGDIRCIISGKTECKGESCLDTDQNGQRFVEWCWTRSPGLDGADTCLVSLADITDRKRAEEALQASEGLHRALVENIHLGINLVDRDHRVLMVNSATCALLRKSSADLVGKRCFRVFRRCDRICSHCPGTVAMATNQPAAAETEVVRDDGSRYCVRIRAFPVLDTDGQAEAYIEVVEDITDRKGAQDALRESEEKYRQIFTTETDGIFLVNSQTHRFLDVNDAACRMYKYTREEFLNLNHLDVTAQPEESAQSVAEIVRDKRIFVALRYHKKKDGTVFPVEISGSTLDLDGQPVICGVIRDITERRRADEALRASEERLRMAAEAASIGTYSYDHATNFGRYSAEFLALYGLKPDDLLPLGADMVPLAVLEEDRPAFFAAMVACSDPMGDGQMRAEFRIRRPDGEVRWLMTRGRSSFTGSPGARRPGRTAGVVMDITDRKQAEETLHRTEAEARSRADEMAAVMEAMPAITFVAHDPQCHSMTSSRAAHELLRVPLGGNTSMSAPAGQRPSTFRLIKDGRELRPEELPVQRVAATGQEIRDYEVTLAFEDGTRRTIYGNAVPLLDESGKSRGSVGSFMDITQRKQAEERHSVVLKTAMNGFWVVDTQSRILEVNDAFCQITGYGREELLNMSIHDLEAVETPQDVDDHVRRNVAAGSARFETRQRRKDGRLIDVEVSVTYLGDELKMLCSFVRDITEQKQAQAALQKSEAALIQAQRIANVGSWDWDIPSGRLTWSDHMCRMFGQDPENFVPTYEWFLSHVDPEDRQRVEDAIRDVLGRNSPYNIEFRIITDEGVSRIIHTRGEVKFDAQRRPLSMFGTGLDITERKRAEDALRESETRYCSLFENMVEGLAYCQMIFEDGRPVDFVHLAVNEAFETETGLKGVVGRKLSEVVPGVLESNPKFIAACGRVASTGKPEKFEVYVHAVAKWLSNTLYSPKHGYFVAMFEDITERKRLEEERERLVAILEATSDYVGFADASDLHLCYANLAGRKMVGFGSDEDITKIKVPDMHPDWANRTHVETIHPALRRDGIWSGETAFLHRDGHEIPVLMVSLAHKDSSGEVKYFSTISRDITQLRKAEAQLQQAQKMEAVGQLAGGVAHDFRNQLTVIKGYAEMLLRRSLVKDEGKELLGQILQAAERSATIAGHLLAFSRQQVLRPEVVNLDSVAGEMMKSMAKALGEDIRLSVMPRGDLWNVRLDTGQLQQALLNLALNARDAMPKGGQLTIETNNIVLNESLVRQHAGASVGRYAVLTVRDNGTGMSPDTLGHLFEPFFTTKPVGEGTGLGLAMVHGFVTQSGGFIEVQSHLDQGAAFRLYFPAVEDAGESAGPTSQAIDLPKGSGTILVVEDEAAIRRMLQETLQECGYTVLPVGNAQDAMVVIASARQKIDLLITDVVMPGWSGPELSKHFRAVRPGVPVLLISGHAGKTLTGHGVVPADVNLLTKPFTSQTLAQIVREAMRHPIAPDNARSTNVQEPKENTGGEGKAPDMV